MKTEDTEIFKDFFLARQTEDLAFLDKLFHHGLLPKLPEWLNDLDPAAKTIFIQILIIDHLCSPEVERWRMRKQKRFNHIEVFITEKLKEEIHSVIHDPLMRDSLVLSLTPSEDFNLFKLSTLVSIALKNREGTVVGSVERYLSQIQKGILPFHPEYFLLCENFYVEFNEKNPPPLELIRENLLLNPPEILLPEGTQKYSLETREKDVQVIELSRKQDLLEEGLFQTNCLRHNENSYYNEIRKGVKSLFSLRKGKDRITIELGPLGQIQVCEAEKGRKVPTLPYDISAVNKIPEKDRSAITGYYQNFLEKISPHILNPQTLSHHLFSEFYELPEMAIKEYRENAMNTKDYHQLQFRIEHNPFYSCVLSPMYNIIINNPYSIDLEHDHPLLITDNESKILLTNHKPENEEAPFIVRKWQAGDRRPTERLLKRLKGIPQVVDASLCKSLDLDSEEAQPIKVTFWKQFAKLIADNYPSNKENGDIKNIKSYQQAQKYLEISGSMHNNLKELLFKLQSVRQLPPLPGFIYRDKKKSSQHIFSFCLFDFLETLKGKDETGDEIKRLTNISIPDGSSVWKICLETHKPELLAKFRKIRSMKGGLERLARIIDTPASISTAINLLVMESEKLTDTEQQRRALRRVLSRIRKKKTEYNAIRIFLAEKIRIQLKDKYHPTFDEIRNLHQVLNIPESWPEGQARYHLICETPAVTVIPLTSKKALIDEIEIQEIPLFIQTDTARMNYLRGTQSYFSLRYQGRRITVSLDSSGRFYSCYESRKERIRFSGNEEIVQNHLKKFSFRVEQNPCFKPLETPKLTRKLIPQPILRHIQNKDDEFLGRLHLIADKKTTKLFNEILGYRPEHENMNLWHGDNSAERSSIGFGDYFQIQWNNPE